VKEEGVENGGEDVRKARQTCPVLLHVQIKLLLHGAAEIIRVKNETILSQYRACNVLAWRVCGVHLVWRSSFLKRECASRDGVSSGT
jgi:hypothetical protein